ncbi:hypothetical protein BDU57DRAFT_511310 [Ampelomyces quisqualis]|uniref:Uncharacterized protein n=1 Tax=Ampelomyces quisqualis TaxID=50730 RepID=A0A6A5QT29_AMPQU|nr:hypothetical protein BDU57DRAFT_511310 [Ampelomyces quisqualis]
MPHLALHVYGLHALPLYINTPFVLVLPTTPAFALVIPAIRQVLPFSSTPLAFCKRFSNFVSCSCSSIFYPNSTEWALLDGADCLPLVVLISMFTKL